MVVRQGGVKRNKAIAAACDQVLPPCPRYWSRSTLAIISHWDAISSNSAVTEVLLLLILREGLARESPLISAEVVNPVHLLPRCARF